MKSKASLIAQISELETELNQANDIAMGYKEQINKANKILDADRKHIEATQIGQRMAGIDTSKERVFTSESILKLIAEVQTAVLIPRLEKPEEST